jgi:CHAD domain-containing protein/CYTH domain-containing protein
MTPREKPLLDLPAPEAVTRVGQGYLDEATAALARLKDRRDTEALHDFRVAVRRLRSVLRAYRRWLGRAGGKKVRRRLRDLGDATNAGRDAEVQLAWLEQQRAGLSRGERTGLNWMARRLRATKRAGYVAARRRVRADFERVGEMLGKRLKEPAGVAPSFREAFTLLLRQHAADLEARLAAVRGADDEEDAHEARISAKRLRYLLEPVREESDGVRVLVDHLKVLQDLLGELHDMHILEAVLEADLEEIATDKARRLRALALDGDTDAVRRERRRDERLGLVALAARARVRRDALFAELDHVWLHDRNRTFFREATDVADEVSRTALPVERERKYLLRRLPERVRSAPVQAIEQGWLPGDRLRERLRHVRDDDGERFFRTIKLGSGIERVELEEETTAPLFAVLWPLTKGCRITKRRYRVSENGLTWEIDEFLDRKLVLAEVELAEVDQAVTVPAWLRPALVREVTGEPAYLNLNLATSPATVGGRSRGAPSRPRARRGGRRGLTGPRRPT